MDELKVKKQPLPVTMYLADGTVESGTLFLSTTSPSHSGAATIQDLMDEPSQLLPFNLRAERFQLVGKRNISAIRAISGPKPAGFFERVDATIKLIGSHTFNGHLLVEGGRGERISDAIMEDEWLRMETQGGFVWAQRRQLLKLETR